MAPLGGAPACLACARVGAVWRISSWAERPLGPPGPLCRCANWSDCSQRKVPRAQGGDADCLSPEGPAGNGPLGGSGDGKATINSFILQMFAGEPLSPGARWALRIQIWRTYSCPQSAPSSGEDRQTDRQSDVESAEIEATTGNEGNRTETEGSEGVPEEGRLSRFLEGQGRRGGD